MSPHERINAGFWDVLGAQMLDPVIVDFPWDYRITVALLMTDLYVNGRAHFPSSTWVVWTPDNLAVVQLDQGLPIPQTVLDAIEADVRGRGFVFPRKAA